MQAAPLFQFLNWKTGDTIVRGYVAKRGQQHEGGSDSPDVMHPIDWLHVEVKRTESLSIYKAMDQAISDAKGGQVPTVWHRRNKKPWLVVMYADDFFDLIEEDGTNVPSQEKS